MSKSQEAKAAEKCPGCGVIRPYCPPPYKNSGLCSICRSHNDASRLLKR